MGKVSFNQGGPRRDPRRLFSSNERTRIASRQHWQCAECKDDLPQVFHVHHVTPWSEGGVTEDSNGVAICPDCHRTAAVRELPVFRPRHWQREATPAVLPKLRAGEFATVSAAPGAGKTLFATWVYRQLADLGDVARVVVFVPNSNLRTQWSDVAKTLNVFLHTKGTTEPRSYDGVVLTYHSLSDAQQVQQIIDDAAEQPTLFILDEVHHLAKDQGGEAGAWAINIARIVGSFENALHPVLNLSGTLIRSKKSERISTIQYETVDGGKIQTVADYAITAGRLISEKQLRHIKVLGFDADMRLEAVELDRAAHENASTIRAVDIDDDARLRAPVLNNMIRNDRYIAGILDETITRLGHASMALHGAAVKGLVIADDIDHAEQLHAALSSVVGSRQSFIAHGRMSSAEAEIQRFRLSNEQAIMVAVQKVTEGFDVPDICVLTYMRTWRASLFINQMVGRAMRVTDRERELGFLLPATILVPNETEIKAAFADVLVGSMQVLEAPAEPCPGCGRESCACLPRPRHPKNKICSRCGYPWRLCTCPCGLCGKSRWDGCTCPRMPIDDEPPMQLEVVSDGEVVHVNVDGNDLDLHIIAALRAGMQESGIPEVMLEQVALGVQKKMMQDPMTFLTALRFDSKGGDN
jgi:superfamily II DNA or RNA helicase